MLLSKFKSRSTRSPGYKIPTESEANPEILKPPSTVNGVNVAEET